MQRRGSLTLLLRATKYWDSDKAKPYWNLMPMPAMTQAMHMYQAMSRNVCIRP